MGAPNVNEVSAENEINALEERYNNAAEYVIANGSQTALEAFEHCFTSKVQAVINIKFPPLSTWLLSDDAYKNYYRLTNDGLRDIATPENDRKRNIVDSFLFGYYARDMVFAALSLKNEGLKSYGNCTVLLDENIIIPRVTVIEENSYNFAERHGINLEKVEIPKGYRAIWGNKLKLAVAKLHLQIDINCIEEDFCNLVLFSDGNKENDEFMEVHIYNELSEYAVKSINIPATTNRIQLLEIDKIKDKFPAKFL